MRLVVSTWKLNKHSFWYNFITFYNFEVIFVGQLSHTFFKTVWFSSPSMAFLRTYWPMVKFYMFSKKNYYLFFNFTLFLHCKVKGDLVSWHSVLCPSEYKYCVLSGGTWRRALSCRLQRENKNNLNIIRWMKITPIIIAFSVSQCSTAPVKPNLAFIIIIISTKTQLTIVVIEYKQNRWWNCMYILC